MGFAAGLAIVFHLAASKADDATSNFVGWMTNGAVVYARVLVPATNAAPAAKSTVPQKTDNGEAAPEQPSYLTNNVFHHYLPDSLNHLVWTNFIAHTNGRDTAIWSVRTHSMLWPVTAPVAVWNTNSLIWGMKGVTALSPCWEVEGLPGQVSVTALTRRHGYTRGHGMGDDGFNTNFAGKKIWFLTADTKVIQVTVERDVVRTFKGGGRDYTILLFSRDLPAGIQPMRVVANIDLYSRYRLHPGVPVPVFKTEQSGHVSAEVPGLTHNIWKPGDSGSPDMLPLPGELVFWMGRSTSGPSPEMQADMDELCELQGLNPKRYQLQWVDVSNYPVYN